MNTRRLISIFTINFLNFFSSAHPLFFYLDQSEQRVQGLQAFTFFAVKVNGGHTRSIYRLRIRYFAI